MGGKPLTMQGVRAHPYGHPNMGQGNVDLNDRPVVANDGSYSTLYSGSFRDKDGQEVLVPGVRSGLDRQMTEQEAKDAAAKKAPITIETVPSAPPDSPLTKLAGDGFTIGWNWSVLPPPGSNYERILKQHE